MLYLLEILLDKNQKTRIKVHQIRNHEYFKGFNFDSLIKKTMEPPMLLNLEFLQAI